MRRTVWMMTSVLAAALSVVPAHAEDAATAAACAPPLGVSQTPFAVNQGLADASPGLADSDIRWTRWTPLIRFGDAAALAGQVVAQGGAVPGATVDLYGREVGTRGWELVASATSDPDTGVFEFGCLHPNPGTDYRAVYDGTLYYRESSAQRRIRVARAVPDQMQQTAPDALRYAGEVRPDYGRSWVLLQARNCRRCSWRSVDRDTTDRGSDWSFLINAEGFAGRRWFRAMVPASDGYARSVSQHVWTISFR